MVTLWKNMDTNFALNTAEIERQHWEEAFQFLIRKFRLVGGSLAQMRNSFATGKQSREESKVENSNPLERHHLQGYIEELLENRRREILRNFTDRVKNYNRESILATQYTDKSLNTLPIAEELDTSQRN